MILAGDFGGGGAFLALGMVAALWEAARSGQGQVVDAAIVDGALNLMAYVYGNLQGGTWAAERQANLVDGGDWRYAVYRCRDGRFVSLAILQPKFLRAFLAKAGVDLPAALGDVNDRANWPGLRTWMADVIATRDRDEWVALFDGDDDCVQPVLDLLEAPAHPHHEARGAFVTVDGTRQPAPAPRFSRTPSTVTRRSPYPGEGGADALRELGPQRRRDGAVPVGRRSYGTSTSRPVTSRASSAASARGMPARSTVSLTSEPMAPSRYSRTRSAWAASITARPPCCT